MRRLLAGRNFLQFFRGRRQVYCIPIEGNSCCVFLSCLLRGCRQVSYFFSLVQSLFIPYPRQRLREALCVSGSCMDSSGESSSLVCPVSGRSWIRSVAWLLAICLLRNCLRMLVSKAPCRPGAWNLPCLCKLCGQLANE